VVARVVLVVVALAAIGWLGVLERDTRLTARGVVNATRLSTAGGFERAQSDLRAARLLNPDTTPDVDRAIVYRGSGRGAAGRALIEDVLRREPDNLTAWALLYTIAGRDPAVARRALAARARLDPFNARARPRQTGR
jgi:hypothetical protein